MTELERCELAKERGFAYDPISGKLTGINGNVITRVNNRGYIHVAIYKDKQYTIQGHRLAWFLHYGNTPTKYIDHIDGNKCNNAISNLRDVTHQQNHWNQTSSKGYYWNKIAKKFRAHININGKIMHLGYFLNKEEARIAYLKAKDKYHIIN